MLNTREGNDVTGSYNYVNPAGALVTVNYEAGVDGFSQTRDVEQGAVQMRSKTLENAERSHNEDELYNIMQVLGSDSNQTCRNIPGAWTGPLAGLEEPTSVPATTSSISSRSSSQVSQEALIAQILSSIQPKISSAVQGALSSQTAGRRTVAVAAPRQQPVRVAAPRPIAPRYNFKTRISSKAQFQASSRSGRTFFAQSGADLLVARQPRRCVRQRGDECEVRDAPVPV